MSRLDSQGEKSSGLSPELIAKIQERKAALDDLAESDLPCAETLLEATGGDHE